MIWLLAYFALVVFFYHSYKVENYADFTMKPIVCTLGPALVLIVVYACQDFLEYAWTYIVLTLFT